MAGCKSAAMAFISLGVVFYGFTNLNFRTFTQVSADYIFLLVLVFLTYIISILLLSYWIGLKEKTGYLIAAGSAICGASAIAIASRAMDAEPDDISLSLIPVFITALIGLVWLLPFLKEIMNLTDLEYGVFAGTTLHFTGFVKTSIAGLLPEVKAAALAVKTFRYLGLLFIIPVCASFIKNKLHVPWYLWAFLGAGIVSSLLPQELTSRVIPLVKIILNVLWGIAMAAIGLNANMRALFTKTGLKSLTVSFASFLLAVIVFLIGINII